MKDMPDILTKAYFNAFFVTQRLEMRQSSLRNEDEVLFGPGHEMEIKNAQRTKRDKFMHYEIEAELGL